MLNYNNNNKPNWTKRGCDNDSNNKDTKRCDTKVVE